MRVLPGGLRGPVRLMRGRVLCRGGEALAWMGGAAPAVVEAAAVEEMVVVVAAVDIAAVAGRGTAVVVGNGAAFG